MLKLPIIYLSIYTIILLVIHPSSVTTETANVVLRHDLRVVALVGEELANCRHVTPHCKGH